MIYILCLILNLLYLKMWRYVEISVFYFKPNIIDPFIIISYDYLKNQQKIKLTEISFFKNESAILEYIKINKFEVSNHKDAKECSILLQLENAINDYLTGTEIDLFEEMKSMDILLDISNLFKTDFSQKVINSLIKIRPGESTTYSDLAKKINSKAYRAVGSVLRNNPLPLIIPCHRVIKKDGKIGGFMGKMDEDWQINLKRSLLRIEGIL